MKKHFIVLSALLLTVMVSCNEKTSNSTSTPNSEPVSIPGSNSPQETPSHGSILDDSVSMVDSTSKPDSTPKPDSTSEPNSTPEPAITYPENLEELIAFLEANTSTEYESVNEIEFTMEYLDPETYYWHTKYLEEGTWKAYDDNHSVREYVSTKTEDWSDPKTAHYQHYLGLSENENVFYDILCNIDDSSKTTFETYNVVNENPSSSEVLESDISKLISFNTFEEFKDFLEYFIKDTGVELTKVESPAGATYNFELENYFKEEESNRFQFSFELTLDNTLKITNLEFAIKEEKKNWSDEYEAIQDLSCSFTYSYGAKFASSESVIKPSFFQASDFDLALEMSGEYSWDGYNSVEANALIVGRNVRGVATNVVPSTALDVELTIKSSSNESVVDLEGNILSSGTSHLTFVNASGIEKEIDVTAKAPSVNYVYINRAHGHDSIYKVNELIEVELSFTPSNTEDTFTVKATLPDSSEHVLTPDEFGIYSITSDQAGTVRFDVVCDQNNAKSDYLNVTVIEEISDEAYEEALLKYNYSYYEYDYFTYDYVYYYLTFKSDHSGTICEEKEVIAEFEWNIVDGEIKLNLPINIKNTTYSEGKITFTFSMDDNLVINSVKFDLEVGNGGYGYYNKTFTKNDLICSDEDIEKAIVKYNYKYDDYSYSDIMECILTFKSDHTGTLYLGSNLSNTFEWHVENGELIIDFPFTVGEKTFDNGKFSYSVSLVNGEIVIDSIVLNLEDSADSWNYYYKTYTKNAAQ
ncbi:MAG: hypothetical protein J1F32_03260 [Erysipelotrichales bacterium]|nr:hypothetical protein [Erysipelotrichales bacterium]